jgi:hypothetical protein
MSSRTPNHRFNSYSQIDHLIKAQEHLKRLEEEKKKERKKND